MVTEPRFASHRTRVRVPAKKPVRTRRHFMSTERGSRPRGRRSRRHGVLPCPRSADRVDVKALRVHGKRLPEDVHGLRVRAGNLVATGMTFVWTRRGFVLVVGESRGHEMSWSPGEGSSCRRGNRSCEGGIARRESDYINTSPASEGVPVPALTHGWFLNRSAISSVARSASSYDSSRRERR